VIESYDEHSEDAFSEALGLTRDALNAASQQVDQLWGKGFAVANPSVVTAVADGIIRSHNAALDFKTRAEAAERIRGGLVGIAEAQVTTTQALCESLGGISTALWENE
jgi:hypothetical protein